ncbi:hypothetical protein [Halalkalibacter alkalisediminis]|uniref:Polymer-forming cytoskeletal protein n=1 Tax=Halalkalibacter alkalisediminis TaxID=935616 RepID=A0ABV6NHI6_9BACI|nr:hypothetical protein [Halalkalibacter alkalisediminis]
MKVITGNNKQDLLIETDTLVMGSVEGDIRVLSGAKLHLKAKVKGNIHLNKDSVITIQDKVIGNIYDSGASIEVIDGEVEGEILIYR